MRVLRSILFPAILLAIAVGSFAATLRFTPAEVDEFEAFRQPLTAPAVAVETRFPQPATLNITASYPSALSAGTTAGVITDSHLTAGQAVTNGDLVIRVGNLWTVALWSEYPQWRTLQRNDRGPDVESLQHFLSQTWAPDLETTGVYNWATAQAVKKMQSDMGMRRPDGISDPAHYVWLTEQEFMVDDVVAHIGDQLDSSATLAQSTPTVIEHTIRPDGQFVSLGGTYEFVPEASQPIDVTVTNTGEIIAAEPTQLLELESVQAKLAEDPNDSNRVSVSSMGTLRLASSMMAIEISPSAVMAGSSGRCVWIRDGESWSAHPVEVLGTTSMGAYAVRDTSDLEGVDILINPMYALSDPSCP